jgi:transcriptional regulator GlxA family with amidase domain
VEDGKYFTSSGVSAGMDMALAVIARLCGREKSLEIASRAEYEWHEDASRDPFAV